MKRAHLLLALLVATLLPSTLHAQYRLFVSPTVPMAQALTGHYVAVVNDAPVFWGGYGTRKNRFTGEIDDDFQPNAFGATVNLKNSALFIGGRWEERASTYCVLRKERPQVDPNAEERPRDLSGQVQQALLPTGLYRHGAILVGSEEDGRVYVVGGLTDSTYNNKVYALDWPEGKTWEVVDTLPGLPRVNPLLVATDEGFLVMGGCTECDGRETLSELPGIDRPNPATWQADAWEYNLDKKEWTERTWPSVPDSQLPAACGNAVQLGRYCTLFAGGRERDGSFRSHLVVYNSLTDTWTRFNGDPLLARTDAALTPYQDGWLLSGGETAVGERTSDVSMVQFLPVTRASWTNMAVQVISYIVLALCGLYILFVRRRRLCAALLMLGTALVIVAKYRLTLHYFASHPEAFPFDAPSLSHAVEHHPIVSGAWLGLVLVPVLALAALARQVCLWKRKRTEQSADTTEQN